MNLSLDIMEDTPVGVGVNALNSLLLMKQKLPRATTEETSLKVVGPSFIDTSEAIDEFLSYDACNPAPDDS